MNLTYNSKILPMPRRIFLCNLAHKPLYELNSVDRTTSSLECNYLDFWTLKFTMSRYVDHQGKLILANGYDQMKVGMYLYLEDVGYFLLTVEPEKTNDGDKEVMNVEAKSADYEFMTKNLFNWKVNTGEDGSAERLDRVADYTENHESNIGIDKIAINYCTVYNPDNPYLSILDMAIEKMEGWKIGFVDPQIKDKQFQFDIENTPIYTFLRDDFQKATQCVVVFDFLNYIINVYTVEKAGEITNASAGEDTNIFITYQNLAKTITVNSDDNDIYTAYKVAGGEGIDTIADVNYGEDYIYNLDYFLCEPYVDDELAEKIKAWFKKRDTYRDRYISLSKYWNQYNQTVTELTNRVPVESLNDQFTGYTIDEMINYMAMYESYRYNIKHDPENYEDSEITSVEKDDSKPAGIQLGSILDSNIYLGEYADLKDGKPVIFYRYTPELDEKTFASKIQMKSCFQTYVMYGEIIDHLKTAMFNKLVTMRPGEEDDAQTSDSVYKHITDVKSKISDLEANEPRFQYNNKFNKYVMLTNAKQVSYFNLQDCLTLMNEVYAAVLRADVKHQRLVYSKDWETNWALYGIKELEAKIVSYEEQIYQYALAGHSLKYLLDFITDEALPKKFEELTPEQKAQYESFEDYLVVEILPDKYKQMSAEERRKYSALINYTTTFRTVHSLNKNLQDARKAYEERVAERDKYLKLCDGAAGYMADILKEVNINAQGFTDEDLLVINRLLRYSDYQNANYLAVSTDTPEKIIDKEKQLFDFATNELSKSAQPQCHFECTLDNFLAIPTFQQWHHDFTLGNFIYLGFRPDYNVKLRLMTVSYNPFDPQVDDLTITFSNMIKGMQGIDDFISLLGQTSGQSPNSITVENRNGKGGELQLTTDILQMIANSSAVSQKINAVTNANAVAANAVSAEQISAQVAEIDNLSADSAFIKYLESNLVVANEIKTDELIAKLAKITELEAESITADNAFIERIQSLVLTTDTSTAFKTFTTELLSKYITAKEIFGDHISTDDFSIQSNDGGLTIADNTITIKDGDNTVRMQIGKDKDGNFSFAILDKDGKGTLINENGITENAIGDGIIREEMLKSKDDTYGGIGGDKLNVNDVIKTINEDGTETISSAKIYYDNEKKSLNTMLDSITSSIKESSENLQTNYYSKEETDKQITSKLGETTIEKKDGTIVSVKEALNEVLERADSFSREISDITTKMEDSTTPYSAHITYEYDDSDKTISMHCTVYKGNEDVTKNYTDSDFVWSRDSDNKQEDVEWNSKLLKGQTVTIPADDAKYGVTFACEINAFKDDPMDWYMGDKNGNVILWSGDTILQAVRHGGD